MPSSSPTPISMATTVSRSRQVRNQADLPPEIMDYIFAQLGPRNSESSQKLSTETLRSCLFVSRYYRAFALPHLFQSIRIYVRDGSSLPSLDLLLNILCPSGSLHVQWISILPVIRHFDLSVRCHYNTGFDLIEPYLLRLLSMLSGDQTQRLKTVALSFRTCCFSKCCHYTKAFQDAVVDLLKTPRLQSIEIEGAGFLSLDFLQGHIRQLNISSYNPRCYSHIPDEETRGDSLLRSLSTDASFPPIITPGAESMLESLDHLGIFVHGNSDDTYGKVVDMLRFTASLKTLTLAYDGLYGFCARLLDWGANFGEMQALESLEILIGIDYIDEDVDGDHMVSAGTEALSDLSAALNTIHLPMPRWAHLRWVYSFCTASLKELPFRSLEAWLRSCPRWGILDRTLTSDLFPALSAVQIEFHISHLILDEESINQNPGLDVTVRMQRVRDEVFSRSVAALGEKFELELKT